jgi:hypothetical protein
MGALVASNRLYTSGEQDSHVPQAASLQTFRATGLRSVPVTLRWKVHLSDIFSAERGAPIGSTSYRGAGSRHRVGADERKHAVGEHRRP